MAADDRVRVLVETLDVAARFTQPLTTAITKMLEATAAELGSEEASVLVRDGEGGDLRFLAAIGKVAEQLKDLAIPAGKGIAGFVYSSGQPIAVSNVEEESTFYPEIDRTTGFSTEIILATPLRREDEVFGVLEYINRRGSPPYEPFTSEEMDKAGRFAEAIAPLVNAYEAAALFEKVGSKLSESGETKKTEELLEWLSEVRTTNEYRELMQLAVLLRDIASRGPIERKLCKDILEAISSYSINNSNKDFLEPGF